jgi:hypothetical protein
MRIMRGLAAFLGLAYVLLSTVAAAETRTFVIANAADGYGVDQCLATGASCGALIANSYCQSQDFSQAASFRKIAQAEVTGTVIIAAESAKRSDAGAFIAIECTR